MNTLSQLSRTYRNLCKQVQQADARIHKAKAHVHELGRDRQLIIQELEQLRTLMDYCVITGENPTQAKLSHTLDQMNHVIQEHRRQMRLESDYIYSSGGINLNTSTLHSTILNGALGVTPYTTTSCVSHSHNLQDDMDLIQGSVSTMP